MRLFKELCFPEEKRLLFMKIKSIFCTQMAVKHRIMGNIEILKSIATSICLLVEYLTKKPFKIFIFMYIGRFLLRVELDGYFFF